MKARAPKRFALLATATLAFALLAGVAAADEKWIHVKVDGGDRDEQVTVNLPVSLLTAAARLIPEDVSRDIEIELDDLELDWADLVALWDEVKAAPEATFVTVESRDEHIAVSKRGDQLLIRSAEGKRHSTDVDVTFPLAVVDALLSGPDRTLNFAAALDTLAALGSGNLISVRDGDETVRVWIDSRQEAD